MLSVQADVHDGAGRAEIAGRLATDPDVAWELTRMTFENFDAARWLGDRAGSDVTGTFRARGGGTARDSLHIAAAWDFAPSRYGAWEDVSGDGAATVNGRILGARARVAFAGGEVVMDTLTAHWAGEREFDLPNLRFRDLDLARWTGDSQLRSSLSGTLRLRGALSEGQNGVPPAHRLSATGLLNVESSRFRERSIEQGSVNFRLSGGALELGTTLATDAGSLDLIAEMQLADESSLLTIRKARFGDLDVGAWAGGPVSTLLNGELSGEARIGSRRQDVARGGDDDGSEVSWSAAVRLTSSRVGPLALTAGEAVAAISGETFRSEGTLSLGGSGAEFQVEASPCDQGPAGHARLVLPLGLLRALPGRDSLAAEGDIRVEVDFAGTDPDSAVVTAGLNGRGRFGEFGLDSLFAALQLADGALTVDTLAVLSNVGKAAASGRVVLTRASPGPPSDVRLRMDVSDPAPLRTLLGGGRLELADGELEARVTGRPAEHAFDLRGTLRSLTWNDMTLLAARAEARGVLRETWRPDQAAAVVELQGLQASALRLESATARVGFEESGLRFDLGAQLDPATSLSFLGDADRDSLEIKIRLDDVRLQADTVQWRSTRPAHLRIGSGRLALDSLEVRAGAGFVTARGILDRYFQPPLTQGDRCVADLEGWILGVF